MPIYEYKCDNGHLFDVMQRMSDDPLTECVECGAPVRKVLQPVGISFKGSGFYSTDYSGKSKGADIPANKENGLTDSSKSASSNGSSEKKDSPEKVKSGASSSSSSSSSSPAKASGD